MSALDIIQLEKLKQENLFLKKEAAGFKEQAAGFKEQIAHLEEQIEWFQRQIFGKRSEKIIATNENQLILSGFGDLQPAKETKAPPPPPKPRKNRGRNGSDKLTIPQNLPIERTVIDLPEEEKICPTTGRPLAKIGEEVSSKLAHRPGSFFVKQIVRPKYGLPNEEGVAFAELPDSLLPRCLADESLLAEVLVSKFNDHLPLYRMEEIFGRSGIGISRQLLSQWVINAAIALEPLYNEMYKAVLESGNIFIDESPVSMLAPGKGKTHQAYMWVVTDSKLCVYEFREDRKYLNVEEILNNYKGVFHSDKYGAYERLAKEPELVWCPCWAHIRRKFFEAESGDPALRQWMLRQIRYLFMLERVAQNRPPDERLRIRQQKQIPLIDKMINECKQRLVQGKLLPKSKLRTALGYFCSLIPYLKNFAYHPQARPDNNTAERAIRPLAIGRKNWMFVGSNRGGRAAAVVLSLIQSCRNLGVNPREYLEDVMRRLMAHPANRLHELLPDQWTPSLAQ